MKIVGISAKVANDREDLIDDAWELFANSEVLEYLDGQNISDDIISVYYEYEGDHTAPYSLLIGYEVEDTFAIPNGLNHIDIKTNHVIYDIDGELPDAIIEKWHEIWNDTSKERVYNADFDRYNPKNDTAEVHVEYKK